MLSPSQVMSGIVDPLKAELMLVYELSHNGVNLRRVANARSAIYQCLAKCLLRARARYSLPPMPLEGLEGPGLVAEAEEMPGATGMTGMLERVLIRRPLRVRTTDE